MKHIGRIVGLVVMLFILVVTPCAFWSFNISRVAMDPQTYKGALKSQNFYSSLLPALVDLAANQSPDPVIKDAARSLAKAMTPEEWAGVENTLLPANWLETQLNQNIDNLFQWLDGTTDSPNIQLDLKDLKDKLGSTDVSSASQIIVPKLPACTSDQQQAFKTTSDSTSPTSAPPICNPGKELQPVAEAKLSQIFNSIGANLPPVWRLSDAIQRAAASAQRGPNAAPAPVDMNRVRAFIWLDNRFVALLFLIPLGLFAIIMMVTIRSTKSFFRWLGWGLILSGFFALIPVLSLGTMSLSTQSIQQGFGNGGVIVGSLLHGMVSSVTAGLALAVLIQAAVVIVVGLICVFISILMPKPEADLTPQEQMILVQAGFSGAMTPWNMTTPGSTPMTPTPWGATTPQGTYTPPAGQTPLPGPVTPPPGQTPLPAPIPVDPLGEPDQKTTVLPPAEPPTIA